MISSELVTNVVDKIVNYIKLKQLGIFHSDMNLCIMQALSLLITFNDNEDVFNEEQKENIKSIYNNLIT